MTTTTVAGVVTAVNSGKRDSGHLEQFTTGMDFEDKYATTNRQVMSPNSRALTPRTRRFVHKGKHDEDED
eukprot:3426322-Amphidinium_carterae.1